MVCSKRCSLFLLLLAANTTASTRGAMDEQETNVDCDIYIAESTISGAGLGTFTAIPRKVGEQVGPGELCIPLIDYHAAQPRDRTFSDYYWKGHAVAMYFESNDVSGMCAGLGAIVNSHIPIVNLEEPSPDFDGRAYEGIGAVTPYYNSKSISTRDIPAGSELFIQYVDSWFEKRTNFLGLIPLSKDYPAAQKLLKKYVRLEKYLQKHHQVSTTTSTVQTDLYDILKQVGTKSWESRLWNALPAKVEEARIAAEDMAAIHQPHATRSVEWLRQNGRCVDHIQDGSSSTNGSRGAFARRNLPQGTLVTTSPIHILPKHKTWYHPWLARVPYRWRRYVRPFLLLLGGQRHQVLQNYCWGHPDSSWLLCPYGSGVQLINHSSTQPNVRVQWAKDFPAAHDHTLVVDKSLSKVIKGRGEHPLLALEYVALRDIHKGEEILVDYGPAWEAAWQEHRQAAARKRSGYVSATMLNAQETIVRTEAESKQKPYPRNVHLRCHYDLIKKTDPTDFIWNLKKDPGEACRVLERDDSEHYTVRVANRKTRRWEKKENVPRTALRFFDELGTTELHWRDAFRHEMHMPDDVFPDQWKEKDGSEMNVVGMVVVVILMAIEFWKRCRCRRKVTKEKAT